MWRERGHRWNQPFGFEVLSNAKEPCCSPPVGAVALRSYRIICKRRRSCTERVRWPWSCGGEHPRSLPPCPQPAQPRLRPQASSSYSAHDVLAPLAAQGYRFGWLRAVRTGNAAIDFALAGSGGNACARARVESASLHSLHTVTARARVDFASSRLFRVALPQRGDSFIRISPASALSTSQAASSAFIVRRGGRLRRWLTQ